MVTKYTKYSESRVVLGKRNRLIHVGRSSTPRSGPYHGNIPEVITRHQNTYSDVTVEHVVNTHATPEYHEQPPCSVRRIVLLNERIDSANPKSSMLQTSNPSYCRFNKKFL